MALNEAALADKIAAIMSGNFFLPPVPSKKKKSKGHRKSSSLSELPSNSEVESENDFSLNGDESESSSQQSSVFQSYVGNSMHRSHSEPTFEQGDDHESKKNKVSFIHEAEPNANLNADTEASFEDLSAKHSKVKGKSVHLLESGEDFSLFNSNPNKETPSANANIGDDDESNDNNNKPNSSSTGENNRILKPKLSAEPSLGSEESSSSDSYARPLSVRGGGRIVKPSGGSGRFFAPSITSSSLDTPQNIPEAVPQSTSIEDSSKRLNKTTSFEPIHSSTPVGKNLSISTGHDKLNGSRDTSVPRQRRLSIPNSPATTNKYTHELLASTNTPTSNSFHPERPVKVAVRVRPFLADESDIGDRRTLSKLGDNLVIVNPSAFEADPDAIAAAALALDNKNWAHVFEFDHCLWSYNPETKLERFYDQEEVHITVGHEIVDSVLQGVSASCFAYGHTSTGKTYSLFGNVQTAKEAKNDKYNYLKLLTDAITPELGLIPRVFCDIVSAMQDRDGDDTKMYFSFVEIYNEKIRDLLSDGAVNNTDSRDFSQNHFASITSTPSSYYKTQQITPQQSQHQTQHQGGDSLKVREHPIFGPYIEGLQKVEVFTPEEVLRLIARGLSNRSSSKSHWNAHSSRSHAIVTLELSPSKIDQSIHIFSPPTKVLIPQVHKHINIPNTPYSNPYHSIHKKSVSSELQQDHSSLVRVQMVDLAGSERDPYGKEDDGNSQISMHNNHSGIGSASWADGVGTNEKERKELKFIRKSLTTLGFIIKSLARGASPKTMPYRDTILTYLMKDALNGINHTTMLATISPASSCYDETLCTLRYAEHLCLLKRTSQQPFSAVKPYSTSLVGGDKTMQGSKQSLLEDFPYIHEDLGSKKPGSVAARQLLRQTVSDPQQRIAKMLKSEQSTDKFRTTLPSSGGFDENGYPNSTAKKQNPASNIDLHDVDEMKNTHRQLQSDYIELQIDLDAVKTDRDTLLIELKNARDKLANNESEKSKSKIATIQLGRALKTAETELNDLRAQITRKDENIDRLMNDLADEKQARLNADNGYQSRIKEFLSRFESMKSEISILNGNLDDANKKYRQYQDEKNELLRTIEELKERINKMNRDKESLLRQIERMSDESDGFKKELSAMKDLRAFNEELSRRLNESQAHIDALNIEKAGLLDTISHKDSLFNIQQQKSETIINTLNQRIVSLEKIEAKYNEQQSLGIDPEEFFRMQNQLKELFAKEGKVLYSELIDTEKLTVMIRDMRRKLQDFEVLQKDYDEAVSLRQTSENEKLNLVMTLRNSEDEKQHLLKQIEALKNQNQNLANGLNQQMQSLQTQLRNENALLKEQIIVAQREAASSREELLNSRESSQKEFASLWKSVQELNELDLLKDKSIQDLIADRDRAILERDHAQSRVKMLSSQCESLQQEIDEIDNDLLAAVESEESKMSTTGNFVVLHNVSDRMMHGLARRQIDKRQAQVNGLPAQPADWNSQFIEHSPKASYPPASAPQRPKQAAVANQRPRPASPTNSVNTYHSSVNSSSAQVAPYPTKDKPPPFPGYANQNPSLSSTKPISPARLINHQQQQLQQQQFQDYQSASKPNTSLHSSLSQKQQQQYVQELNFSDDYALSEKILERQIEELSDFLQDESKLKKSRHRSTMSGASSITDSYLSVGGNNGKRVKNGKSFK